MATVGYARGLLEKYQAVLAENRHLREENEILKARLGIPEVPSQGRPQASENDLPLEFAAQDLLKKNPQPEMKALRIIFIGISAFLLVSSLAAAAGTSDRFYASSERFGYTGTVSVYDTWEDANSGLNARCSEVAWPQCDGAIFAVKNAPEYYVDSNEILTNWFANNGASPSDKNEGFFQLYGKEKNDDP